MKREYPEQPLVGVGAIIVDAGRIALVERGHPPLLGEWSIPGGMVELGETLRQAAERETLEETGLVVRATELLGVFDRIVADSKDEKRTHYHYILIDFLCERISGDLRASGDAADARWFTPEEAHKLALDANASSMIKLGFERAPTHGSAINATGERSGSG